MSDDLAFAESDRAYLNVPVYESDKAARWSHMVMGVAVKQAWVSSIAVNRTIWPPFEIRTCRG